MLTSLAQFIRKDLIINSIINKLHLFLIENYLISSNSGYNNKYSIYLDILLNILIQF